MRLLRLGVCGKSWEFNLIFFSPTRDCGVLSKAKSELSATSWSSTHFSSSSAPFRLSYLHTPHLLLRHLLPPVPSLLYTHTPSVGASLSDSGRLWATVSFGASTLQTLVVSFRPLCTFLGFQREPQSQYRRLVCWRPSLTWAAPGWNGRLMLQLLLWQHLVGIRLTKRHCKFNFAIQFLPALLLGPR